jgi:hypothetical protein
MCSGPVCRQQQVFIYIKTEIVVQFHFAEPAKHSIYYLHLHSALFNVFFHAKSYFMVT